MGARSRVSLGAVLALLVALLLVVPTALPVAKAGGAQPPSAPRSVTARADADSVTIGWKRPRPAGAARPDKYQVAHWAAGVPKRRHIVAAGKRSLDVGGLVAGTTYTFTVRAHNPAGWGRASKPVTATLQTTTTPPPGPPTIPAPPQPLPGFGAIAGPCGAVAPELVKPTPSQLDNRLDFGTDPFDPDDLALLTAGGQAVYTAPSTGGTGLLARVFAFEVLARCEGASLLKTDLEIGYESGASVRTSLLVRIGTSKAGVMVTRAFRPSPIPFTQADADTLVWKKLEDVNQSTDAVLAEDAWVKQLLVVVTPDDDAAQKVRNAWLSQSAATRADTVVYVVTTDGADGPLY